jgi:hypothetical protein
LQCSGCQLEIAAIAQLEEISICFRLTGPRGRRFSPATDVITFWGLIHLTFTATTKVHLETFKNKSAAAWAA